MSSWLILIVAGLFEMAWVVGLKYTEGFTRLMPSLLTAGAMAASVWLLSIAVKALPIGTAYAVWVGIGVLGAAVCGVILFKEPLHTSRVFFLALLLVAIVGLKLTAQKTLT